MAAKKILMLVGDYAENYETMAPFQALQMVNHQVHATCPDKRAGQSVRIVVHDFEGDQTYSEKSGHNFTLNTDFAQARTEDYDALLIPGGCTSEYLRLNGQVLVLVCTLGAACKLIVTICHGTQLSVAAGILQGWVCNAYPAYVPGMWLASGEHVDIPSDRVYIDDHLVTAPAWPVHPAWLARFLEVLGIRISH